MGVLTDYFLASPSDLAAISSTGEVPPKAPRIQYKGFGVVELGYLTKQLGLKGSGVPAGQPEIAAADFSWFVLPLTADLVAALAALDDAKVDKAAAALSKKKGVDLAKSDLTSLLSALAGLARQAKPGMLGLHLWTSA
ncbi:MAG: hypothetical protein IPJ34_41940 [Myxococcales bacterium]|nr:hypothetical protein [Myxococcales bacterium]